MRALGASCGMGLAMLYGPDTRVWGEGAWLQWRQCRIRFMVQAATQLLITG